jgi:hypothetical protein
MNVREYLILYHSARAELHNQRVLEREMQELVLAMALASVLPMARGLVERPELREMIVAASPR